MSNNNDLQSALDGIVNAGADAPDFGVPPVPPMAPDPTDGLMNDEPESIEEQVIAEDSDIESVAADVEKEATHMESNGLTSVKEDMIIDLLPIIDKIDVAAEKKFALYKEIIDARDDKSKVPAAYEAAKGIEDDKAKAEALLYLIDKTE